MRHADHSEDRAWRLEVAAAEIPTDELPRDVHFCDDGEVSFGPLEERVSFGPERAGGEEHLLVRLRPKDASGDRAPQANLYVPASDMWIFDLLLRLGNESLEQYVEAAVQRGAGEKWMREVNEARELGKRLGFQQGRIEGDTAGYERGVADGKAEGYEVGLKTGRDLGVEEGRAREFERVAALPLPERVAIGWRRKKN